MFTRDAKHPAITLVGGGDLSAASLTRALSVAPYLIGADGGADAAIALGHVPDLVVGDLDSLSDAARARLGAERIRFIDDQNSTDFDKALDVAGERAGLILAVGFSGKRLDHTLAALSSLLRRPNLRVVLDTGEDLCVLLPPRLEVDLPALTRVSLYPMDRCRCGSTGLNWATDALSFDPAGQIGTSNHAVGSPVRLTPNQPTMLAMLPVEQLAPLIEALARAPLWPAPAPAR